MRVSPFQGNAHQVTEKRNAACIRRLRRGELCISAASGRGPYHRALQVGWSRFRAVLMLLSAYPAAASGVNGTKVISG